MRSPINVLESLKSKACNREYSYERLYRNLYNPEFYLLAYTIMEQAHDKTHTGK